MHQIHLSAVKDTFDHHGYGEGVDQPVDATSLSSVLTSLYTNMDLRTDIPIDTASAYAEVLMTFLFSLYDRWV